MTIRSHDQRFVFTGSTSSHIKPKLQTMMACINRDDNDSSVAANNNTTATPAASSSSNPLLTMPFVASLGMSSSLSRATIHHVADGARTTTDSNNRTSSTPSFAYRIDEERHLGNISINHQHEQQRLLHRVRIQQILEEAIILVDECENTMRGYHEVEVSAIDDSIGQARGRNPRHSISLVEDGTSTGDQ